MHLGRPKLAFFYLPGERGAKIFMLGIETLEPFALCWTGELSFRGLAEIQEKMQEPRLDNVYLARLPKPVEGVLADCFQHAVAGASFALFQNEQGLIDQSGHRIQNIY